jgi:Flp pilus assembly protein TadG
MAINKMRKTGKIAEAGQSMVEMAFILPIFLVMVFAIIEIGRAWAVKQSLTNAAREGARILVLPYGGGLTYASEGDVQTAARDAVISYLNNSGVPVGDGTQVNLMLVQPGDDYIYGTADDIYVQNYTDAKRGDRVGIQVRHNFDTALPIILGMFRDPNAPPPPPDAQPQTGITMGVTCYMDHE